MGVCITGPFKLVVTIRNTIQGDEEPYTGQRARYAVSAFEEGGGDGKATLFLNDSNPKDTLKENNDVMRQKFVSSLQEAIPSLIVRPI